MNNEIEKFDPSKLMEGVKDRIKATFVSLIPDDQWESMIEKELYVFTTGRIKLESHFDGSSYKMIEVREPYKQQTFSGLKSNDDDISPLQRMIRDMLREQFKKNLTEFLASEEYQSIWKGYGEVQASKAVQDILVKNAETVFVNFISGMMQTAMDNMRADIVNTMTGNNNYRY